MIINNKVKAELVRSNEVNDVWRVYNLGREDEYISFPRTMESNEDDAISEIFK